MMVTENASRSQYKPSVSSVYEESSIKLTKTTLLNHEKT